MLYSIVIPCYNSSETIEEVVHLTRKEMEKLGIENVEFILVNDCSPDEGKTIKKLTKMSQENNDIVVIDLAKNVGQHNAVMAGLNYASGDSIISMDDDLQTHPSQIYKLLEEFQKGFDVVYGYYPQKKHSLFRNFGSYINYLTVRMLIGKPKNLKTSSFWIIRKFVRDNIIKYTGYSTYLQGLFLRTTRNISSIPVEHFQRKVGKSNYTIKKLIGLWSNIMGFSIVPLRAAAIMGNIFSVLGIIGACMVLLMKIVHPNMTIGWPSLMVAICFFSGINLMFLGIIGEYVGRMYLGLNKEPQFIVKAIYKKDVEE